MMDVDSRETASPPQGWGTGFLKAARKQGLRTSGLLKRGCHTRFSRASSSSSLKDEEQRFSAEGDSLVHSQQFYSGLASQDFSQDFSFSQAASISQEEHWQVDKPDHSSTVTIAGSAPLPITVTDPVVPSSSPRPVLERQSSFKTKSRIDAVYPLSPCHQGLGQDLKAEEEFESSVDQRFLISSPCHSNSYLSTVEESPDARDCASGGACRFSRSADARQSTSPSSIVLPYSSSLSHQNHQQHSRFCFSPNRLLSLASKSPTGNRSFKTIDIPFPVISPKKAFVGSSPGRHTTVVSHKSEEGARLPATAFSQQDSKASAVAAAAHHHLGRPHPLEGQEADEPPCGAQTKDQGLDPEEEEPQVGCAKIQEEAAAHHILATAVPGGSQGRHSRRNSSEIINVDLSVSFGIHHSAKQPVSGNSVMKVFGRKPNSRSGSNIAEGELSASNRSSAASSVKNDDLSGRCDRSLSFSGGKLMGGSADVASLLIEEQLREQLYGHGNTSAPSSGPLFSGQHSSSSAPTRRLRVSSKVVSSSSCMGLSLRKMVAKSSQGVTRSGYGDSRAGEFETSSSSRRLGLEAGGKLSSRFPSALFSMGRGHLSKRKGAEELHVGGGMDHGASSKGEMKQTLLQQDEHGHHFLEIDRDILSRSSSQRYGSGESKSRSRGSAGSNWKLDSIGNFLDEEPIRAENVKHSKRWVDLDVEQIKSEIFTARSTRTSPKPMRSRSVDHQKRGERYDSIWGKESGSWDAAASAAKRAHDAASKAASVPVKNADVLLNDAVGRAFGNGMSRSGAAFTSELLDELHSDVMKPLHGRSRAQSVSQTPRSLSLDRSARSTHGRPSPVFSLKDEPRTPAAASIHLDLDDLLQENPRFKLPQQANNVKDRVAFDADHRDQPLFIPSTASAAPVVSSSGCSPKSLASRFMPNSSTVTGDPAASAIKKLPLSNLAPAAATAGSERVRQPETTIRDMSGYTSGSRTSSSVDVSIHHASSEHIISEKHQLRHQNMLGAGRGRPPPRRSSTSSTSVPPATALPISDKLHSSSSTSENSSLFTSFEVDNAVSAKKNFLSDYVFSGFRGKASRPDPPPLGAAADRIGVTGADANRGLALGVEVQKHISEASSGPADVYTPIPEQRVNEEALDEEEKVIQETTTKPKPPLAAGEDSPIKLPSLLSPSLQERLEQFLSVQLHLSETGRELVKVLKSKTGGEEESCLAPDDKVEVPTTVGEGNNLACKDPALVEEEEDKCVSVEANAKIFSKVDRSTRDFSESPNEQLNCYLEKQVKGTPQKFNILSNCSTDFEDLESGEGGGVVQQGDDKGDVPEPAKLKDIQGVDEKVPAASLKAGTGGAQKKQQQQPTHKRRCSRDSCSGAESSEFSDRARSSSPGRSAWSRNTHHEGPVPRSKSARYVGQQHKRESLTPKLAPSHQRTRRSRGTRDSDYYNTYLDLSSSGASTPRVDSWHRNSSSAPLRGKENSRHLKQSPSSKKSLGPGAAGGNKGSSRGSSPSPPAERRSHVVGRDRGARHPAYATKQTSSSRKKPSSKDKVVSEEDMMMAEQQQQLVDLPSSIQTHKVRESVPVMKTTFDPYQDFRTSMIAMIVEKGITEPCELEELLQAYLTLNAVEYHHLIVAVFSEVWHQIFDDVSG